MSLNPKQQRFVVEYLKSGNASEAARQAGYSVKNADVVGPRLLGTVGIREAIAAAGKKAGVTPELVLGELLRIARVDIADAFEDDGRLKKLSEMSEDTRRAISGIDIENATERRGTIHKLRFWDKPRALELLGKNLKLFTDKVEHSGAAEVHISINGITK